MECKLKIGSCELKIETGKIAKLANGSVTVTYKDTVVLVTATASSEISEGIDFFPLTVEYREKAYATGRIPGGFFKREGRPKDREIITARLIDRSIRPLFPEWFMNEVQIMTYVLSSDKENDADFLGIIGASASLCISNIPFDVPIAAVKVGRVNKKFIINPTFSELRESDLDLIVVGSKDGIVMLEGGSKEVPEIEIISAIDFAKEEIHEIINIQNELVKLCGKQKKKYSIHKDNESMEKEIRESYSDKIVSANYFSDKLQRKSKVEDIKKEILNNLLNKYPDKKKEIKTITDIVESAVVRRYIIEKRERPDGRGLSDIRDIKCEIGVLPRTHGSAIFTRGQTQALVVTTLGTSEDAQIMEELEGETKKKYMLQYNFPAFATGEVKPVRGPGRREIGHGLLAEKAILPLLPGDKKFPYTIQVVSDILESNGSSSMATVCGASLSLMDAGIPIKSAVAGISIGLIKENNEYVLLTDIQGLEDHFGDMDFKIAGTKNGVTAIQLDIKTKCLDNEILKNGLLKAREAINKILEKMAEIISSPREKLSDHAPRIVTINISPDRIKDIIGPGGKIIRKIIEDTSVKIDISNDGKIDIASNDEEMVRKAISIIRDLSQEAEVGKIYSGKVKKVTEFGAFVEIFPGKDGLIHISQLAEGRVNRVNDVVSEGDEVMVKVIEIDKLGKVKLSRKEALRENNDRKVQ